MKVSVIVPCHNAARWIGAALCSIAEQTYPAFETIVIDDQSTDGSVEEIKRCNVPVRLLSVRAGNAAIARNVGIENAKGDWIALLDADDRWYPNHLQRAVQLLAHADDVAFMASHDWIGLNNEPLPIPDGFVCKVASPKSGMNVDEFLRMGERGFHFGHSTVLYRLDRVREVGGFDPSQRRRHDIDLWFRMIADRTCTYDPVVCAAYRENTPGSLSKAEAECDYFHLRALVKNLPVINSPIYRRDLEKDARRAMGRSFVDGTEEHYARIRELAWPFLSAKLRFMYRGMAVMPSLARELIKLKRRVSQRRRDTMVQAAPDPQ